MTGKTPTLSRSDIGRLLNRGYSAFRQGAYNETAAVCKTILQAYPKTKEAHFLMGLLGLEKRQFGIARDAFKNVVVLDETHTPAWAQLARVFVNLGQYSNANKALDRAIKLGTDDPLVEDVIGTVYSLLGDQTKALEWYDRANAHSPTSMFELSRAKSLTFLGRIQEARTALTRFLEAYPDVSQGHWMLARLEKVTDDTHVAEMEELLKKLGNNDHHQAMLSYALGKEYEDLSQPDKAFEAYSRGAAARRREVPYNEQSEDALYKSLPQLYSRDWYDNQTEEEGGQGFDDRSPIFIIGQPRTGTTLVERIITAHSEVHSAGELQQFGMAIKRMTGITTPGPVGLEGMTSAVSLNLETLGKLYIETSQMMRGQEPHFVDKMPINYLYAPLIAKSLPNAKIIHITRDPADSCFASFKQLFADAYFHSYDQEEMARHHLRYRELMKHWRALLGDRMLEVSYEDVVSDLEGQARRIINYLDLDWQDACAKFHKQTGAVTTASAVQVREKAHTRSVGLWRQYQEHLGPMLRALKYNVEEKEQQSGYKNQKSE
ncbi:tetratricopeptide repeat-containing sulfotransferase family protein [Kordiimonas sediminis]|nr:sulfotransferase [Kordiimonas sediminis]